VDSLYIIYLSLGKWSHKNLTKNSQNKDHSLKPGNSRMKMEIKNRARVNGNGCLTLLLTTERNNLKHLSKSSSSTRGFQKRERVNLVSIDYL